MAAAWACEMTALEKPWHPTSSPPRSVPRRSALPKLACGMCALRRLPPTKTASRKSHPDKSASEKSSSSKRCLRKDMPDNAAPTRGFRKSPARALPPLEVGAGQLASPESRRSQLGVAPTGVVQVAAFEAAVSQLGSLETRRLPGTAATGCPPCWLRTVTFRPACTA